MIKDKIIEELKKITGINDIQLAFTDRDEHGDYTSNIAMVGAKEQGKNPKDYAQQLVDDISQVASLMTFVSKIEVAGPGFINFHLKEEYLTSQLQEITSQEENYGKGKPERPLKIVVEMGDPNTHKLPHIGHLFNYIVGDSIARMYEFLGHEICKVTWQGDVGPHVAKAIYGWRKRGKKDPEDVIERMRELQESYVLGANVDSEVDKEKIKKINKQIYLQDPDVYEDWRVTKQWSIEFDEYFENKLGIKIKFRYLEGDQWKRGVELVKKHIGKVFEESEGAIVFKGEKFGLHTRVFLTKEGTPTYEAKEFGLETQKMIDFPFDLTIIPTASEQNGYFKVVIKAIEEALPEYKNKIKHLGTGMIQLSSGKMSSRSGNIVTGPDLVFQVEANVAKLVSKHTKLNENEKQEIVNMTSIGAVKYAFLKNNIFQDSTFDINESVASDGNSGPYIQYTYARTQSILTNAGDKKDYDNSCESTIYPEELSVMKHLIKFPEIVANAAQSYSPNLVANYLFELAQKYNTFYNKHKVIGSQKEEFRLLLSRSTGQVLKNGLALLGIEAPERM